MTIEWDRPAVGGADAALTVLREWQDDGAPFQLHPGDLGWFRRFGSAATDSALRTWSRDGRLLAIGLLDGPGLLRLAIAPRARRDEELARRLALDLADPLRGVPGKGTAYVEAPADALLQDLLSHDGWDVDEPWTPLRRDLAEPVEDAGVRTEVIGPDRAGVRARVHRAAFDGSTFTDGHWHAMAAGPAYADARCLVAYDDRGEAVAAVTVWSAGPGRPGLLEPMGVAAAHRGHGHGRAITLAAAAVLRESGSSSAVVATPSSNVGAVATYRAAGFEPLAEVRDRRLDGR
ncbi:GNAT family N-acetyltransferase [Streptomyces sp. NPDC048606]|uniref:GNAT family N-acetyltransferase n=1 Tax=Streptomyces sp. NPDC048606 TaxID=3154726 RepID=UPI003436EBF0